MPRQIATFLNAAGPIKVRVQTAFGIIPNDTTALMIDRVTLYIRPTWTQAHARIVFKNTPWREGEDCNQFYMQLIDASRRGCNFGVQESAEIAD